MHASVHIWFLNLNQELQLSLMGKTLKQPFQNFMEQLFFMKQLIKSLNRWHLVIAFQILCVLSNPATHVA